VRFCLCFIGTVNRTAPGTTDAKYRERWADRCREWVTRDGHTADVTVLTFLIAVISCGDIDYVDPNSVGNGGVLNFGLTDGTGRRPKNGWMIVLRDGRPREALAPAMVGDWRPARRIMPSGNERWLPGRVDIN
jgi:hypothetical protein